MRPASLRRARSAWGVLMARAQSGLPRAAVQLLLELAGREPKSSHELSLRHGIDGRGARDIAALLSADLLIKQPGGTYRLTSAGYAHVARHESARAGGPVDPFRTQHLKIAERLFDPADGKVTVDDGE